MIDAALLHDRIGGVPGLDFLINGEVAVGDRTEPNIVITLPVPDESAAVFPQQIPDNVFILCHYAKSRSFRSRRKFSVFPGAC